MIEIFIPILWICIDSKCEFMQSQGYFTQEIVCERNLEQQKDHMRELVKRAGRGKITVLEGICADAKIKARIVTPVSGVEE